MQDPHPSPTHHPEPYQDSWTGDSPDNIDSLSASVQLTPAQRTQLELLISNAVTAHRSPDNNTRTSARVQRPQRPAIDGSVVIALFMLAMVFVFALFATVVVITTTI